MSCLEDFFEEINNPSAFEYEFRIGDCMMSKPRCVVNPLTSMDNDCERKLPDAPNEDCQADSLRQTQRQGRIVEQDSILAWLLTSTPTTSVPTSVGSDIVSQLPEERQPEDLVDTPLCELTSDQFSSHLSTDPHFDSNSDSTSSDPDLTAILDNVFSLEDEFKISRKREDFSSDPHESIQRIKRDLLSYEASLKSDSTIALIIKRFSPPPLSAGEASPEDAKTVPYAEDNWFTSVQSPPDSYSKSLIQVIKAPGLDSSPKNLDSPPTDPQRSKKRGSPQSPKDSKPPQEKKTVAKKQPTQRQRKRSVKVQEQVNESQAMPRSLHPASAPIPEGTRFGLSNATAPNDTYQRYVSMPQPQMSARYNVQQPMNYTAPLRNNPQLSPVQYQQQAQQCHCNQPQCRFVQTQTVPAQTWMQQQASQNAQQQNMMFNTQQALHANQQPQPANYQPQAYQVPLRPMQVSQNPPNSFFRQPEPVFYQQQNATMVQQRVAPPQAMQQQSQRMVPISNPGNPPHSLSASFTANNGILPPQPPPGYFNHPAYMYEAPVPVTTSSGFSVDVPVTTCTGGYSMTSEPQTLYYG